MRKVHKRHKVKNKKLNELIEILSSCKSWAEFNIMMTLNGYDLDSDVMLSIVHFAFADTNQIQQFCYQAQTYQAFISKAENVTKVCENCQSILIDACEDSDKKFDESLIDAIIRKIIFKKNSTIAMDKIKKIAEFLWKKDSKTVRKIYDKYSTFKKFSV